MVDVAPLTVRRGDAWPKKQANRHMPSFYLAQALQEARPEDTVVMPVLDVIEGDRFPELEAQFQEHLGRRTGLRDVVVLNEYMRKEDRDPERDQGYVDFLNSLDIDLNPLDTTGVLQYEGDNVVGFSGRLSCTLAEALVYFDKMRLAQQRGAESVVLVTGYDESYADQYGVDSSFRDSSARISQGLQDHFDLPVEIVQFLYALNPRIAGYAPVEFSKEFDRFTPEEQKAIVAQNALYALATADLYGRGEVPDKDHLSRLRLAARDSEGLGAIRDILQSHPISNQADFDNISRLAHWILSGGDAN